MKLTYLSCPYSHSDPLIREARFRTVNRVASDLMAAGEYVFSPISMAHPIALAGGLPTDWHFWKSYDQAILQVCDRVGVVMLPGWEQSVGVNAEVELGREMNLQIAYYGGIDQEPVDELDRLVALAKSLKGAEYDACVVALKNAITATE